MTTQGCKVNKPYLIFALALAIQFAYWLALGFPGAMHGAILAFGIFASREVAQAEKRKTDWPPEYAGLYLRGLFFWMWDTGSQQDLFWPTVGVLAGAGLARGVG